MADRKIQKHQQQLINAKLNYQSLYGHDAHQSHQTKKGTRLKLFARLK